jgi:hypothetical protein
MNGVWRGSDSNEEWLVILGLLTSVAGGVNVFLPEGLPRTQRFYAHHGVRPGVVWAVKVLVWAAALLAYGLVMMGEIRLDDAIRGRGRMSGFFEGGAGGSVLLLMYGFAVGQLCGQVIRRQISALLIALILTLALFVPQVGLARLKIIPEVGLLLTPLIVLAISRAWAGDWMFDQRGAGRWVRLALLLAVPLALLPPVYVGHRAWSVPDIGPPFVREEVRPAPTPAVQAALTIYGQAIAGLRPLGEGPGNGPEQVARVISLGWDPEARLAVAWWEQNREAIARTRRASALPVARAPGSRTLRSRANRHLDSSARWTWRAAGPGDAAAAGPGRPGRRMGRHPRAAAHGTADVLPPRGRPLGHRPVRRAAGGSAWAGLGPSTRGRRPNGSTRPSTT